MPSPPPPRVDAIDHLVLTVADIDRSVAFYSNVLGMREERFEAADGTTRRALSFGGQKINLHQESAEFEPKAKRPTPGSADLCLLSRSGMTHWMRHLETHTVPIEGGPVRRTGAAGPILSIYLRDPDGNLIEVSKTIEA